MDGVKSPLPRKDPSAHQIGGWEEPKAVQELDKGKISFFYLDSKPEPSDT